MISSNEGSFINFENTVTIQDYSKSEFCDKVEKLLLSPPEWVRKHVQNVRNALDGIPSEMSSNYCYSPTYNYENANIKFECTRNNYKITLRKNEASPVCALQLLQKDKEPKTTLSQTERNENTIVYSGPITPASVSQFPQDLQQQANKFASSAFPYTATIDTNGSVTVGGSVTYVGKKINLRDLLKKIEEEEKNPT